MNAREKLFAALPEGDKPDIEAERRTLVERLHTLTFGQGDADVVRFIERAREAGSTALRCATIDEAVGHIIAAAERIAATTGSTCRCIAAAHELLARAGLQEGLRKVGSALESVTDAALGSAAERARDRYAQTDIGITVAIAGLADSGAILISSSQSESRSVSLLPMEHIALLPAGRILPSFLQAAPMLRTLATRDGTSAATLVGGPSKTADIEKVLVTGVHGPAALTILVVDDID
ncbi:MAG: LUD domain-containing protein [Bacteroidetes bacterium]|nr:LUD domain-containing protein [Bacteroidota bacterium]